MQNVRVPLTFAPVALAALWVGCTTTAEEPRPADRAKPDLWAFTAPKRPTVPTPSKPGWVINPIDAFILDKLEANGLTPNDPADKLTLLRRVSFDLTGLPPTIAEQDAFLADTSSGAYGRVVDRLLASPRYGERWAQHWLDVVRYAETDGFKADDLRPFAHRYRDYVIQALNDDLPYDRFVRQQLAGDELEPGNPSALIATGFNRLHPDEYNAANLEQRRQEILDDITDVTGLAFLGLTIGCARCHDHKFDPIKQTDYFQLQAFFAALKPRDDVLALDPAARKDYQGRMAAWEVATRDIRKEMDSLVAGKREDERKKALEKFRAEIQEAVLTPAEQRTPYQTQIALMAEQQLNRAEREAPTKMAADQKKRYKDLEDKLAGMEPKRPSPLPAVMAVSDVGNVPPPVHLLDGGDWRKPRQELQPGFPEVLGTHAPRSAPATNSTGRRSALAGWLTRPDHPLTARVMVNRLWQHHFGTAIVATPNDFGAMGSKPTHPELLDWLAVEFVESGWSLKQMHRLMVLSATYRQSSLLDPKDPRHVNGKDVDPENSLLWRANRRRLEGETARDAMLAVSDELSLRMFGPSARPKLPEGISNYAWKPDPKSEDQNRRSVYVLAKRNLRYPMFDAFDLPDMHNSCGRRLKTTTAPQALLFLNGEFTSDCAVQWAKGLLKKYGTDEHGLIADAYRAAWGRAPTNGEVALAKKYLERQSAERSAAVTAFCHALLNTNEFLYID